MLEFVQGTKAIGDRTGLEASSFPCQDVRRGIANHQRLLGGTTQRRQRRDDGIRGRLELQTRDPTLNMLEERRELQLTQDCLSLLLGFRRDNAKR